MAITHYGTIAGADAYALAIGNTFWGPLTDEAKTAALVRASAFVDSYSKRPIGDGKCWWAFMGDRTGGWAQMRQWPRHGITDLPDNLIPDAIEYATYEAAFREAENPGALLPDVSKSALVKREKVDVLEVEYAVDSETGTASMLPTISAVEALLAQFLVRRCTNSFYIATV